MWIGSGASPSEKKNGLGYAHVSLRCEVVVVCSNMINMQYLLLHSFMIVQLSTCFLTRGDDMRYTGSHLT